MVSPGHKGEQAEADFKNWYKGLDYKNFPVLIDPSGKLLESYGVRSYPTQAFIDKEGKLVKMQQVLWIRIWFKDIERNGVAKGHEW